MTQEYDFNGPTLEANEPDRQVVQNIINFARSQQTMVVDGIQLKVFLN